MKVSEKRLKKFIEEQLLSKIKIIGRICSNSGIPCFLVGGTVRDIVLELPQLDIDLVAEGDISLITSRIKDECNLAKLVHSQFETVKLFFQEGFHIDMARARKETYPEPAVLPVVKKSNIKDDIRRRDFTINTLLMGITPGDFGEIYDYVGGLDDIKNGIVKVLHRNSFIDDPTRILRAFRFKERFSFQFAEGMRTLMDEAVAKGLLTKLTPHRVRKEFFLILDEKRWDKMVLSLSHSGILEEFGIKNRLQKERVHSFYNHLSSYSDVAYNHYIPKLLLITEKEEEKDIKVFSDKVGLKMEEIKLLIKLKKQSKGTLDKLSKEELLRKDIYHLLKPIPDGGIIYLLSKGTTRSKKRIKLYLDVLKDIKTEITGEDLKKLGIKQGPIYNVILNRVLDEKINGKLETKDDEIKFVEKIIPSQ
jgi:tRNA nucleotidyltransferase (CCA-adding enzyme)